MNDGGPAFPHGPLGMSFTGEDGYTSHQCPAHEGMTLRGWFAGQALAGLVGTVRSQKEVESLGVACYQAADELLAERSKQTE